MPRRGSASSHLGSSKKPHSKQHLSLEALHHAMQNSSDYVHTHRCKMDFWIAVAQYLAFLMIRLLVFRLQGDVRGMESVVADATQCLKEWKNVDRKVRTKTYSDLIAMIDGFHEGKLPEMRPRPVPPGGFRSRSKRTVGKNDPETRQAIIDCFRKKMAEKSSRTCELLNKSSTDKDVVIPLLVPVVTTTTFPEINLLPTDAPTDAPTDYQGSREDIFQEDSLLEDPEPSVSTLPALPSLPSFRGRERNTVPTYFPAEIPLGASSRTLVANTVEPTQARAVSNISRATDAPVATRSSLFQQLTQDARDGCAGADHDSMDLYGDSGPFF